MIEGKFKIENELVTDITVDTPEDRAEEVKKILDDNLEWKVSSDDYEIVQTTATVNHKYHPDGIDLFYYHAKNKSKPRAVLFTFHGYGSSTRINASLTSNILAQHGIDVIGFDNEGHGRNTEDRKERCYIKNYKSLLFNGAAFIEYILDHEKERLEDVPIFLSGFSMGGGIVSAMVMSEELRRTIRKIDGVILYAPAIEMVEKPKWLEYQGLILMSKFFPKKVFKGKKQDCTLYGKDRTEWFEKHEDSYSEGVKICTGRELVRMGNYVRKNAKKNFKKPMLLFHGTQDNLVKFSGSEKFFKDVNSDGVDSKMFVRLRGMLHAISGDRCAMDIIEITLEWINLRISSSKD